MRSASASLMAPAAASAMTSPKLWPPTAAGVTPSARSKRKSPRLCVPMAGCAHSVAVSLSAARFCSSVVNCERGKTTSCSLSLASARLAAVSHAERTSSNETATSRPISMYWLPCPGKSSATPPSWTPRPKDTPPGRSLATPLSASSAACRSFCTSSASLLATTATRAPCCEAAASNAS